MKGSLVKEGDVFGRLKVRRFHGMKKKVVISNVKMYECECECGGIKIVSQSDLRRAEVRSCGCMKSTRGGILNNERTIRLYKIWRQMRQRCENQKHIGYKHYGARGIKVCDRWLKFENFLEDMGKDYEPGLSLEREDFNAGYSKENCSWIPRNQQGHNTRRTVFYEYNGKRLNMLQWSQETGVPYWRLVARLRKRGWSIEKAITTP